MSTRSRIGIVRGDKVESIYCHFDGYPEGVGATLAEHWTTTEEVEALMSLGDLSALGVIIGEKHSFETPEGGRPGDEGQWCLAYGRDRGEEGSEAAPGWPDSGQEYEYVFDDYVVNKPGETGWRWREIPYGASKGRWKKLTFKG